MPGVTSALPGGAMAIWNAPDHLPGHEKAAVAASLAMQDPRGAAAHQPPQRLPETPPVGFPELLSGFFFPAAGEIRYFPPSQSVLSERVGNESISHPRC